MKQIKLLLFAILGVAVMATSCSDDFSEEDLNNLVQAQQDSVRAESVTALNEAGELIGLQLRIVDTDGNGVEGLTVTMVAALGAGGVDEQSTSTNASGVALFDRVVVGGNIVDISGGDIVPVSLTADFGQIQEGTHYQIINGEIIPTPITESAIVTVIANDVATATVQGSAIIETDLTNDGPEIPQGATILADFDDGLNRTSTFSLNYFFATNDNALSVGRATIDGTTGEYSMTVPAGVRFDLIVSDVSTTQRMAYASENGVELDVPEYGDVDANFGPNFGTSSIPFVRGARVVFDEPSAGGSGFTLSNLMRVPRTRDLTFFAAPTTRTDFGSEVFQFTSLGGSYTESPLVTITDATASNTYAQAHIDVAFTALTATSTGTGYAANTTYSFDLIYDQIFDNGDGTTGTNTDQVWDFSELNVETDDAGVFTQANVNAAVADAIANGDDYFDPSDFEQISDNAVNLRFVNTANGNGDAVLDIASALGFIANFQFEGDDFTNPSFEFSGGGSSTQAALDVDWASQWTFELDNTNTVAYTQLPNISFEIFDAAVNPSSFEDNDVDVNDAFGTQVAGNVDLATYLTLDGGNIVSVDPTYVFETDQFSTQEPVVLVENLGSGTPAAATANVNSEGQVTSISVSNDGEGYDAPFQATIEPGADGAPGSGATIVLIGGNFLTTGEFDWDNDYVIENRGSDYVSNLNVISITGGTRNFNSGSRSNLTLNEGQTYLLNIDYGTGFRSTTYGGN